MKKSQIDPLFFLRNILKKSKDKFMKIPQIEPYIDLKEYNEIKSCFEDNWLSEGKKVKLFIEKTKELLNVKYAHFAPNGTLSLYLSLRAIGIKPGDEVIVPDFTFYASASSVEMVGAIPVFCEVNKENFQMDVSKCQELITKKTKAIMPVHIYGMSVNMNEVKEFADKYNLKIIEDAAQAFSVSYSNYNYNLTDDKKRMAGTFGDIGSFSFYADKTITTGEGGLIVTNDDEINESLLYLRNQGRINSGSFIHPQIGYNFRITDFQAGLGLAQLKKLPFIIENKTRIWNSFSNKLAEVEEVKMIQVEKFSSHVPFRSALIAKEAFSLMEYLSKFGIQPRTFFYPMHKQPAFKNYMLKHRKNFGSYSFENSNFAYDNGVCLPCFPTLKEQQINYVCNKIKDYYAKK